MDWRRHRERALVLLAVVALHGVALSLLLAPARQQPAATKRGKPMQLFWIPRAQKILRDEANTEPNGTTATSDLADPAVIRLPDPDQDAPSAAQVAPQEAAPAAAQAEASPAAARWDRQTVGALLHQLPTLVQPPATSPAAPAFSGGRQAIRLPGGGDPKVEGIVVGDGLSLDERVQGVLSLVGLGRIDPCPDIRRHVQSALAAGDPDDVQHWVNRGQRCR